MSSGRRRKLELGLRINLEGLTELIELIDVGGSEIGRQRGKHFADRDAQRLGARAIDRYRHMRRARTKRRQDALQLRIALRALDKLLRDVVQLGVVEAAAEQFELHLKPAGVADTLDRGRWNHKKLAVRRRVEPFLQMLRDRQNVGAGFLAALAPRLQHDKADTRICL